MTHIAGTRRLRWGAIALVVVSTCAVVFSMYVAFSRETKSTETEATASAQLKVTADLAGRTRDDIRAICVWLDDGRVQGNVRAQLEIALANAQVLSSEASEQVLTSAAERALRLGDKKLASVYVRIAGAYHSAVLLVKQAIGTVKPRPAPPCPGR